MSSLLYKFSNGWLLKSSQLERKNAPIVTRFGTMIEHVRVDDLGALVRRHVPRPRPPGPSPGPPGFSRGQSGDSHQGDETTTKTTKRYEEQNSPRRIRVLRTQSRKSRPSRESAGSRAWRRPMQQINRKTRRDRRRSALCNSVPCKRNTGTAMLQGYRYSFWWPASGHGGISPQVLPLTGA